MRRAEADAPDLDVRILQAEQRLMAREDTLRRGAKAVGQRALDAVRPWRPVVPLAAAAMAMFAVSRLWRGRRAVAAPAHAPAAGARSAQQPVRRRPLWWLPLVGVAWPMLPASWRSRFDPATVELVLNLGPPLADQLFSPRPD